MLNSILRDLPLLPVASSFSASNRLPLCVLVTFWSSSPPSPLRCHPRHRLQQTAADANLFPLFFHRQWIAYLHANVTLKPPSLLSAATMAGLSATHSTTKIAVLRLYCDFRRSARVRWVSLWMCVCVCVWVFMCVCGRSGKTKFLGIFRFCFWSTFSFNFFFNHFLSLSSFFLFFFFS